MANRKAAGERVDRIRWAPWRRTNRRAGRAGTALILSQVYPPDPASVGQHMADVAAEMVRRGHRVIVLTADRGYDDATVRYRSREMVDGVEIRRLPFCSFGKGSFSVRMLAAISYILQAMIRALLLPGISAVLVSTAPPLCSAAALMVRFLRGVPFLYWVMDLNPDQLIALEAIPERGLPARMFARINQMALRKAETVVALDRFMADRLNQKVNLRERLVVIPPWPHEDHLESVPHHANPFRSHHGLRDRFVVMYSGNHSASNPLDTILEAALQLKDDREIVFLFVGGGLEKKRIEQFIQAHQLSNVRCLPYQPLPELRYSLSAADVHLVSLGTPFVGILHPCKVYGAMAIARPILFLGPAPSHVSDILERHSIGWRICHGDVEDAVNTILTIRNTTRAQLSAIGHEAQRVLRTSFSQAELCSSFCNHLEAMIVQGAREALSSLERVEQRYLPEGDRREEDAEIAQAYL